MPWEKCLVFLWVMANVDTWNHFALKFFGCRAICHIDITHSRETQTHQDTEMIKVKQKHDLGNKGLLIARWDHGMPDKAQ